MTVQPYALLRADYADSSYFETDLYRDRGIITVPFGEAHKSIVDYVRSVLSKWEKTDTKSPPVAYTVYLILTANYDDGRKAQRTDGHTSFETVELAMKHTSERTETLLQELYRIGKDNL